MGGNGEQSLSLFGRLDKGCRIGSKGQTQQKVKADGQVQLHVLSGSHNGSMCQEEIEGRQNQKVFERELW